MRKLLIVLVIVALVVPVGVQGQGIRETRPTFVGADIAGRSLFFTATIEKFIGPRVGVGCGGMVVGFGSSAVGVFPAFISFVPYGDTHSLYLSVGATYLGGAVDWRSIQGRWLGTFSIGYQYQSEGGLWIRPTSTVIYSSGGLFLILPGVAIGGSF